MYALTQSMDDAEMSSRGFVCRNVWQKGAAILNVAHEQDGDWQFLCGGDEHGSADEAVLVHPEHIFEMHSDLADLMNLEEGQAAQRAAPGAPWVYTGW